MTKIDPKKELQKVREEQDIESPFVSSRPKKIDWGFGYHNMQGEKKLATVENIVQFLGLAEQTLGKIKHNYFLGRDEIFEPDSTTPIYIDDTKFIEILRFTERHCSIQKIPDSKLWQAIGSIAWENKYDPILDKLQSFKWDGERRLRTWFSEVFKIEKSDRKEDDKYIEDVGELFIRGMIRRQVYPGAVHDVCLCLIGGQKLGKTKFFETLLKPLGGKDLVAITNNDVSNKDEQMKSLGKLVVLFDEGTSFKKQDRDKIKTYISDTQDEFRSPYERKIKLYRRRFVTALTSNDIEILSDPTGNRRFLTVEIKKLYNWDRLDEISEQLFAEAYHDELENYPINEIDDDELRYQQSMFVAHDALRFKYLDAVNSLITSTKTYVTTAEVWEKINPNADIGKMSRFDQMRIGEELMRNGFVRERVRINGVRASVYIPPPDVISDIKKQEDEQPF